MKKIACLLFLSALFLVGCNDDKNPSDSQVDPSYPSINSPGSWTNPDSSHDLPSYGFPEDNVIYPQTIIVDEVRYDMIVDLTNSLNYELDKLIGHIIHEETLAQYIELYPNLIPVIDNAMQNSYTNNMIEIYSVKGMDKSEYLSLKIKTQGNIVHTELFKAN